MTTFFVDVGGTHTRVWTKNFKKTFPTNLKELPAKLKKILNRRPGMSKSRAHGNLRKNGSWIKTFQDDVSGDKLVIGLRGVWTLKEKAAWKCKLKGCAQKIEVLSDIELAHRLVFGNRPGIILNAGTGSIAFGRNAKGMTARAGGLGPLVGDEGSAFWIGREYLRKVYERSGDWTKVRSIITAENPISKVSAFSKKVLKISQNQKDSFENHLIHRAQIHLRLLVKQVQKKLGSHSRLPLHLTGGLFSNQYFISLWKTSRSRT